MEQAMAITLMAIILGASQPALAQNQSNIFQAPKAAEKIYSLDDRFDKCMNDSGCTLKERLQIMGDMNDEMHASLQRMEQSCIMMNYNECISPQREETQKWYKMNGREKEMMRSMEMRSLSQSDKTRMLPDQKQGMQDEYGRIMNETEPAAGNPEQEGKRPWWKFMYR